MGHRGVVENEDLSDRFPGVTSRGVERAFEEPMYRAGRRIERAHAPRVKPEPLLRPGEAKVPVSSAADAKHPLMHHLPNVFANRGPTYGEEQCGDTLGVSSRLDL
jgi:hypothetical protein